jgi:hypothetical protein
MEPMEPMTLRQAARRTSRSITTLRRYIRHGRLNAEMRPGRFGPEYRLSDRDLADAGLEPEPPAFPKDVGLGEARPPLAPRSGRAIEPAPAGEAVPAALYHELQMKHEQLLVQYGMIRAGGLRMLELRAELDASQARVEHLQDELAESARESAQRLRAAELEQEGQRLEIAALREKLRALEMVTRNAATSQSIERQFSEIMLQSRRVEGLAAAAGRDRPGDPPEH